MLWHNARFALRQLRRNPAFAAVAVFSLSLGVGVNTAIYSLFYTVMLRTLPVEHPERLVEPVLDTPEEFHWAGYWDWKKYEYFRDHNHVFSGITGTSFDNLACVRFERSDPETLIQENIPADYFDVLGLKPAIGRLAGEGEVAVVSWSYWDRHFHRDPAILGKRIFYNDEPKTIIGIAPQSYVGPRVGSRTDLWIPVERTDLTMLARLKPGVTVEQAQAEMAVLYQAFLQQTGGPKKDWRLELLPAGTGLVRIRDQYGRPLALLLSIVGLLLLLTCANMASMLLARSAERQGEMAVRVGLGASRRHLAGQMLTESVLLSGAGALAGVFVAYFATGGLVRIMASSRAFEHIDVEVQPDLHLLLVTAGIALWTGLLFGSAPAWYAFRRAPAAALRQTGRGDTRHWRLFAKTLVGAQVAISVLLVTAATIFLGHLSRLRHFNLGFSADHVLQVTLDPSHSAYKPDQLAARYRDLLQQFEALPGVRSASVSGCTPLQGCGFGARFLKAEGHLESPDNRRRTSIALVAPRYFETLGIPLLAGRDFRGQDSGHERVAILSQGAARYYFPAASPIGKHIVVVKDSGDWFGDDQPYEIVGVAGDVKSFEIRDAPYPTIYFDMFQENRLADQFELRTSMDPRALAGTVRRIARDVLKTAPVVRVATLAEQVDSNLVPERLMATLSQFFAVLGAVLAGVGVYGLLVYMVSRRTSEIGVRMALGATTMEVSRMVLKDTLGMLCGGLGGGVLLVLWSRPLALRLVADLQWSATPLLLGSAVILAVALAACLLPAHRAAAVDPMAALRHH